VVAVSAEAPAPPPARRRVPLKVWLPVGLVIAALAGFLSWDLTGSSPTPSASGLQALPRLAVGRPAPAFRLARLGGGPAVSLAAERGTPVVVNFFASWCRDCRAELRTFAAASRAAGHRVDFVGVDTNDTASAARSMLARAGVTYPVAVEDGGGTLGAYRVEGLPTTVFVSRSGRVAGEVFGAQSPAALRRWVERLED